MHDLLELTASKLADSGLTLTDPLGFTTVDAQWLQSHSITEIRGGFVLPYFHPDGTPSSFFRVRHLEPPSGFAAAVDPKAIRRYSQPPGTLNEAYLPPLVDWAAIFADPSRELIITEGELKAACATKLGFPTIGLGGVDCWQSSKRRVGLVPPLDQVKWVGRSVILIYDSDIHTNVNVQGAAERLAKALTLEHGAKVRVLAIPPDGERKLGLDDYLMLKGPERLGRLIADAGKTSALVDLGCFQALSRMNDSLVYVRSMAGVVDLSDALTMTEVHFRSVYANAVERRYYTTQAGQSKSEIFHVAEEWLQWPGRRTVRGITYRPGAPRIVDDQVNTWQGWGCQPKERPVEPWLQLLKHLFNGNEAAIHWFQQWLAYPLQHPGTKLHVAVTLWGAHHGTGKSLIGYTMGSIYGKNFREIGTADLHSSDNDWAESCQFVMGDDITGSDKRRDSDRIKHLITQEEVRINIKYKPKYALPNLCNFYFTANTPFAQYLEDHDRRHYIHHVTAAPLKDEFYMQYRHWLETGGAEGLFNHLLSYDMTGFNPKAHAPTTSAKDDMIYLSRSEAEAWVVDFVNDPDELLRRVPALVGRDWLSTKELDLLWQQHGPSTGITISGRKLGAYLMARGAVRRDVQSKYFKGAIYVFRNPTQWVDASDYAIGSAIETARPATKY